MLVPLPMRPSACIAFSSSSAFRSSSNSSGVSYESRVGIWYAKLGGQNLFNVTENKPYDNKKLKVLFQQSNASSLFAPLVMLLWSVIDL